MQKFHDQKILDSWSKNIQPWINAVRNGEIESRALVTNKAIIEAILTRKPATVLDVGCGEGWLARELADFGIDMLGIDAVPKFIQSAQQMGVGRFSVLTYEDISFNTVKERFDTVVCNFSLLGNESVEHIFQQVPTLLNKRGTFIVQTIHPRAGGEVAYRDGWREGSWDGFSDQFTDPAPWYFRTLESWKALFHENGIDIVEIVEPLHPKMNSPASIIFVAEVTR